MPEKGIKKNVAFSHKIHSLHLKGLLLIYLLLSVLATQSFSQESQNDSQQKETQNRDIVIDELSYEEMIENQRNNSASWLPPYKERRKQWGFDFSFKYSFFKPINYKSFFYEDQDQSNDFDDLYSSSNIGYISVLGAFRFNHPIGAISLGVGVGYYGNEGSNDLELSLIPVVAELALTLDAIMNEPYFAPYGAIGIAYIYIIEEQESVGTLPPTDPTDPGNTLPTDPSTASNLERRGQFALYYDAGLLLQLDWLEKGADLAMQTNSGIENAYIKVGVMSFFSNLDVLNPEETESSDGVLVTNRDLTSNLAFHIGFQIEF